jgi:protein phosphatase
MTKFGSLFAVADGVGGNAAGEVASAEAVNVMLQEFYFGDHTEKIPNRLKNVFRHTALHIYDLATSDPSVRNMKCTLSTLLLRHDRFYIAHVGDSKIFLFRDGKAVQLTKDHSMVGKMVRLGLITPEDARVHPNKNVLLQAVGDGPMLVPDFYAGVVKEGDLFCLLTDGILEHLTPEEMHLFIDAHGFEISGMTDMVSEIKSRGGFDNMTIVTVKVDKIPV